MGAGSQKRARAIDVGTSGRICEMAGRCDFAVDLGPKPQGTAERRVEKVSPAA